MFVLQFHNRFGCGAEDEQWERVKPHLPIGVRGKPWVDDRRVVSGIVHVLRSGCRWCDCPEAYCPPTTIYNRFVRWARRYMPGQRAVPEYQDVSHRGVASRK